MDDFVKVLARNTAFLLYIPEFASTEQLNTAGNMFKVMTECEEFTKDILTLLYRSSRGLRAINPDGERAINMIRDDLRYLLSMEGGKK